MHEIERKWLVEKLPEDLKSYPSKELIAGYFSIPGGVDVRIRQEGDKYFRVSKSGHGLVRDIGAGDAEITEEQFENLWPQTKGRRIIKKRHYIPCRGGLIEFDIYHEFPGFYTAEVEFKTAEDALEFVPPDWFGKEVTDDKRYSNNNLAVYGPPKEIREFNLFPGLEHLYESVYDRLKAGHNNLVILIAGGSASGKTSAVADRLKRFLDDDLVGLPSFTSILSMDDYYRGRGFMEAEAKRGNVLNWDQPEAINMDLLRDHLKALRAGSAIEKPRYSFKTGEIDGFERFEPARVIILEGLFALNDSIVSEGDIRVFVDIGFHGRILRRLLRDIERTGDKPADILEYFSSIVEPMHEKYIQGTMANADFVIRNEYNPAVEAGKSGVNESQLKFKINLSDEDLRKLGAERLSSVIQVDHCYNPKDRNLADTGELMRIREEGDTRILTYKGPKTSSDFRKRPKFEFEISEDVAVKFINLYGKEARIIMKERVFYQINGVLISVDKHVSRIVCNDFSGNNFSVLGSFLEIRSTQEPGSDDRVKEVVAKLGLNFLDRIKKSYSEM